MENSNSNMFSFTAFGVMKTSDRSCLWCQGAMPPWRNGKADYCSNSHRTLAYNARKKELELLESVPEESKFFPAPQINPSEQQLIQPKEADDSPNTIEKLPLPVAPLIITDQEISDDPWRNATEMEKQELVNWCLITKQIKKCVKEFVKRKEYEIPVNLIHSIVPASCTFDEKKEIILPEFILKYSENNTHYIIHSNF
jgi:hypothetical protein